MLHNPQRSQSTSTDSVFIFAYQDFRTKGAHAGWIPSTNTRTLAQYRQQVLNQRAPNTGLQAHFKMGQGLPQTPQTAGAFRMPGAPGKSHLLTL